MTLLRPHYCRWILRQAVQLVSSRDLRSWNRLGNRSWFLGPSKANSGAYDLLELLAPANVIVANDTLLMYYTGIKTRAPDQAPDYAPLVSLRTPA